LALLQPSAILPLSGPVAQLGARFHGMEEVVGSIPTRSTIHKTITNQLLKYTAIQGVPSWR
jgi:hypothetical protein